MGLLEQGVDQHPVAAHDLERQRLLAACPKRSSPDRFLPLAQ
jgi:hypothetical protein